jgi:hypothetical protein
MARMTINAYAPGSALVYMGLSTDTKPPAGIGSKFIETDTGKVFLYLNTSTWLEVALIPGSGWTEPAVVI